MFLIWAPLYSILLNRIKGQWTSVRRMSKSTVWSFYSEVTKIQDHWTFTINKNTKQYNAVLLINCYKEKHFVWCELTPFFIIIANELSIYCEQYRLLKSKSFYFIKLIRYSRMDSGHHPPPISMNFSASCFHMNIVCGRLWGLRLLNPHKEFSQGLFILAP